MLDLSSWVGLGSSEGWEWEGGFLSMLSCHLRFIVGKYSGVCSK